MSSRSTILCSVIPLPLSSTGQPGQAHIQSSSVGICGAQCLFSRFWCGKGLFQKLSKERRHRLVWMHSVKGQHKSKWNHLNNFPVVQKSHIINIFIFKHGVLTFTSAFASSSYQRVLCVSEPFTLLHTQNLKRSSMGCLSLIVDWCTCPLLVLQVCSLQPFVTNM